MRLKLLITTALALITTWTAWGQEFPDVNGNMINYTLSSSTAKVAKASKGSEYTGDIAIPEKVTYNGVDYPVTGIAYQVFKGTTITSIKLPKVEMIDDGMFENCSKLTSVEMPAVTKIGDNAFKKCKLLTTIDIPEGVTSIGTSAFSGCEKLESITIPAGVKKIDENMLSSCTALTSITFMGEVTEIGYQAFNGCSALETIDIPETVTSIGSYAFGNCSKLTDINIPTGVTKISEGTFLYCSALESIELPETVETIYKEAFSGCKALTSINIPAAVTSIGSNAFESCRNLQKVTLEGQVTIGDEAFLYCENLLEIVDIDSKNNLTAGSGDKGSITYYAKKIYTSEEEATNNPIITTVNDYRFFNDGTDGTNPAELINYEGKGTELTLPGLTELEGKGITSYSIRQKAFYENASITSVTIPDCVTGIGSKAFYGCEALTSVEIPDGVTSIGLEAFSNCTALATLTLGKGITSIGEETFTDTPLTKITLKADQMVELESEYSIILSVSACTLYVPSDLVESYKNDEKWQNVKYTGGTVTFTIEAISGGTDPEPPYVYWYTLTIEPTEGVTLTVDNDYVEEGTDVYLTARAEEDYDITALTISFRTWWTQGWIEAVRQPDGRYLIPSVYDDLTIRADGAHKIPPVGMGEAEADGVSIYASRGVAHVKVPTATRVTVLNTAGLPILRRQLPAGESQLRDLPRGIYLILLEDGTREKVIIR